MSKNLPDSGLLEADESTLAGDRGHLLECYRGVRRATEALCAPLETEDYVVQSMPDASPAKWHLAHTSWFYETFLLKPEGAGDPSNPTSYAYLFNSYYNALGERTPRDKRGLLSRPTVAEVKQYRAAIDEGMERFLGRASEDLLRRVGPTVVLGLHHEQQHQELILTDLKHMFSHNPVRPVYREQEPTVESEAGRVGWLAHPAGLREVGHEGPGFAFDNERPRHPVYVAAF